MKRWKCFKGNDKIDSLKTRMDICLWLDDWFIKGYFNDTAIPFTKEDMLNVIEYGEAK